MINQNLRERSEIDNKKDSTALTHLHYKKRMIIMKITDIKIRKLYNTGNVRAILSITIDNCFAVHELRIIQNEDKLFVSMPSRIDETGAFRDIVHPINPETREYIESAVIGFYDNYVNALNGVISDFKMKA